MLSVITCHYNPIGYERPRRNYWTFRDALPDIPFYTAEISFDGEFAIPDATLKIEGFDRNLMWQKERLLNLLLEQLPPDVDKVAWVDADVLFNNPDWHIETEQVLDKFPVAQLFERVNQLDPSGEIIESQFGVAYGRAHNLPDYLRPGFAWAARRDVLQFGLDDRHICGGSDVMMLCSWTAWTTHPFLQTVNQKWKEHFLRYAAKTYPLVRGELGYVSGNINHLYHGSKENRNYIGRNRILTDHDFDPSADIALDDNGLWRWDSDKPDLHEAIGEYFLDRQEDV